MKRIIIVDSSCELENLDGVDFAKIPFMLDIDDKHIPDNNTILLNDIVNMFENASHTASACPGCGLWIDVAEDYDEIFMFPATSKMSGSFNAAHSAKEILLEEGKKVFLFDTKAVSGTISLIVEKTASLIKEEKTFEEIKEIISSYKTKIGFALFSIENLVKNGRAKKITNAALKTLNLIVIGEGKDGELSVTGKKRGLNSAIEFLVKQIINDGYKGGKMIITHCFNQEAVDILKNKILEKFNNAEIKIMFTSGLCSYYCERKGFIVGYEV